MIALPLLAAIALCHQVPDGWPKTTAETSNYTKTSSYAEVMSFLDRLQEKGAQIRVQTIGKSTLGKPIPLVICHSNPNITPSEAKRARLPVVYLQANIHAGEVEGKEATLQLLRELNVKGMHPYTMRSVLVVQPIYNSDGNDKWGANLQNRGHQDGPDPVGERPNGQGLDLNRDCMKAESPEMSAVLKHVYGEWDPDVIIDLHTTNGTRHGYVLTYSPGLNPNCDSLVTKFVQDKMLPHLRKQAKQQRGWEFFDYGDAFQRNGEWTFQTFACDPRYVTNYASVRNRISILSEAASFQPFKLRVETTFWFVMNILHYVSMNTKEIVEISRRVDQLSVMYGQQAKRPYGVRFDFADRGKEEILLEVERKASEIDHRQAPTAYRTLEMTIKDRFQVTKVARLPHAYVFSGQSKLVDLLQRHGIVVEQLIGPLHGEFSTLKIEKVTVAPTAFQGHRMITLDGTFQNRDLKFGAGDYIVRTAQKLAGLAFYLLEGESTDGAAAWGFLGEKFEVGQDFPIAKAVQHIKVPTRQVIDQ